MSTAAVRCEYFELKLRTEAARHFEELPEDVKTDWKLLEKEWKRMYPPRNTYINTTKDVDEFYDLRISDKDLPKRNAESSDSEPEWAIAQFMEKLRYLGSKINDASKTSKGRHAYRHLPPLIRDRLPAYGAQGPALENLCADIEALGHAYITKITAQQERIQSQLDSISRFSAQNVQSNIRPQRVGPQSRQIPTNFTTSNTFTTPSSFNNLPSNFTTSNAFTTPSPFSNSNEPRSSRALRPITNNTGSYATDGTKNANPPTNNSFEAMPDGICQYENAIGKWFATYGVDGVPNASRPFPLTPGSPSPGSSECWRCGHKGHYKESPECLRNNPLPEKEQQYRRIVGASILNAVRNVKTTAAFHIETGTFNEFNRNYAFPPEIQETSYDDHQNADYQNPNTFLGNAEGDDL
ncbi:hypothetical protein M422DRAFT_256497 [Sphaerobolus stellatus SS14]|uniref:CCHC-type domain-containing protein n=1 Tax=Sphaerobolus stellatus (strain SS14) TaxID=990650 RepID=A0A0C9UBL1_SPHS4|nr:hypothetical protein M422DRAFT_256497 [Sphaerobolus stellatus SS14]